jgi:hypothetical protein
MLQELNAFEIDSISGGASFITDVSTGALAGGVAGQSTQVKNIVVK